MKSIDFLDRLGFVLLAFLFVCVVMLGLTYHELQEIEEKTSEQKTIENRLDEMIKKMEKDD